MIALLGRFSARAMFQSPVVQALATSKLCTTGCVPRSVAIEGRGKHKQRNLGC